MLVKVAAALWEIFWFLLEYAIALGIFGVDEWLSTLFWFAVFHVGKISVVRFLWVNAFCQAVAVASLDIRND